MDLLGMANGRGTAMKHGNHIFEARLHTFQEARIH